ncbi:unnamed protein product [Vitrella brassicaformis CCMP3155]|uniref:Ubiquitin-like domain-containing protein n=1 Tax=Vitrella brassicaformis (strain CCMP3155) TaxID=1169540 RepID=A0A0G4EFB5_VITBC|nr:unnamed protein product [Vitrella brassicaformis CCMP3155]|eukprot:CEL94666.1 unnamed protein product [Vitrella brassicaformis CCMP3155]
MTHGTVCLNVGRDDAVWAVEVKLQYKEGIPAKKQTLTHQSITMDNNHKIADYKVREHGTLQLYLPVRAGTFHITSGRHGFEASSNCLANELSMLQGMDETSAKLVEAWDVRDDVLKLIGEVTNAFDNMVMLTNVLLAKLRQT